FGAFLAKYDNEGNVRWVRQAGGTASDGAGGVALDAKGNIYIIGGFSSPSMNLGGVVITNSGPSQYDIFLAKYDPGGNILWAKQAGGAEGFDSCSSIAVTETGDVYVSGYFGSSKAQFDGGIVLTNSGGLVDIFVAKYDSAGNVLWAKK